MTDTSSEDQRAIAGFTISLIAGILILSNGLLLSTAIGSILGLVLPTLSGRIIIAAGIVFGGLVIIGSILLDRGKRTIGGLMVVIFSTLSIIIGGGFLIGLILGIVGGALGLAGR